MSLLEMNRAVAAKVFGPPPSDWTPSPCQQESDARKAAGLAPFIYAGAAYAALGGLVDKSPDAGKRRLGAAGLALVLFLAI